MKSMPMSNPHRSLVQERITNARQNGYRFLDLSSCNLFNIPAEIDELEDIIELDLSDNFLSKVDGEINSLKKLLFLNLRGNRINRIDFDIHSVSGIHTLDLSDNLLNHIPECILELQFIEEVELGANPVQRKVPEEIFDLGFWAIADYLDAVKDISETKRIFQAKLILVGNGEVGKTTLVKKLINKSYKPKVGKEETTHGIEVRGWNVKCQFPRTDKYYDQVLHEFQEEFSLEEIEEQYLEIYPDHFIQKVDINIWDFGGQAIYHATHQFFLTARSLYLLIWDPRKNENITSFDYWLNTIEKLSDSSPVIVVMNKADIRVQNINEAELKSKFPNIVEFVQVSCLTGRGISELDYLISKSISRLKHLGNRLPKNWINIKEVLLQKSNKNFITFDEYLDECRVHDVNSSKGKVLASYLHDLGVILHFDNDALLRNTIFLNPEWVTESVYGLIDHQTIQESNGLFSISELTKYWDTKSYPKEKHHSLVRLMEKFELCFNILGTEQYILAELLPIKSITNKLEGIIDMEFRVSYDFLPSGVPTRLLCRVYNLIHQKTFAKNFFLIKYEETVCLVSINEVGKKIKFQFQGAESSELLAILRNDLKQIHASLNLKTDEDYSEEIACSCQECKKGIPHFFGYSTLKRFRRKGRETIDCLVSAESIEINKLLKGITNDKGQQNLLYSLIFAASSLQGIAMKISNEEDTRNQQIALLLKAKGFPVYDQGKWGKSASGKNLGELDIRVEDEHGVPYTIFEGLNLKGLNRGVIKSHLDKIFGYDVNGLKRNFILIYSESKDFPTLWLKYLKFIKTYEFKFPSQYPVKDISEELNMGLKLRMAKTVHSRSGGLTELFHFFIDLSSEN